MIVANRLPLLHSIPREQGLHILCLPASSKPFASSLAVFCLSLAGWFPLLSVVSSLFFASRGYTLSSTQIFEMNRKSKKDHPPQQSPATRTTFANSRSPAPGSCNSVRHTASAALEFSAPACRGRPARRGRSTRMARSGFFQISIPQRSGACLPSQACLSWQVPSHSPTALMETAL